MQNYEKCKICKESEAIYCLDIRDFEDLDVCEECRTKILNLELVFLGDTTHHYSKLSDQYKIEALRQNQIRLMRDLLGIKNNTDTDTVINLTFEKTRKRFRKYTPIVREAAKLLKREEANKIRDSFDKHGEAGLSIISHYDNFCTHIEDCGLTFYEVIHVINRIADPSFGDKICQKK